jgi:hypothetical protein
MIPDGGLDAPPSRDPCVASQPHAADGIEGIRGEADAFTAAWAEGSAMTLDEAVAHAVGDDE